jgi:hypothetical protein
VPLTEVSVPAGVIGTMRVSGQPVAVETTAGGRRAKLTDPVSVPEGGSLTVTLG